MKRLLLSTMLLTLILINGPAFAEDKAPVKAVKKDEPVKAETVTVKSDKADKLDVYINLDAIWRASEKGKRDLAEIDKKINLGKDELNKLRDELKSIKTQYDSAKEEKTKQELIKQMEEKRKNLMELSLLRNKEIEDLRNSTQQTFVEEIIPLVNKYRQEQGFMVIHRFTPNEIISVDPKIDITEEVLELYNKQKGTNIKIEEK